MKYVINLSKWTSINSYIKLASTVHGVFIRAGYRGRSKGILYTDDMFKTHINGIRSRIPYGVYFFTAAINEEEVKEEVNTLIHSIKDNNLDLSFPILLEVDTDMISTDNRLTKLSDTERVSLIKKFVELCNEAGYNAVLRVHKNNPFIKDLDFAKLWIIDSDYNDDTEYDESVSAVQFTTSASVYGVFGGVVKSIWFDGIGKNEVKYTKKETVVEEQEISEPSSVKEEEVAETAKTIELENATLYNTSKQKKSDKTVSGTYYIWSDLVRNKRIRICETEEGIGKDDALLGWVEVK